MRAAHSMIRAALFRLLLLAGIALLAAGAQAARMQVVPDGDAELAEGYAAYQAGDRARALQLFRKGAERNHRVAQFNLAVMLLGGEGGGSPDPAGGLQWLRRSADGGFARAQYALGLLYERGELVQRSLPDATAWFRKAAEQGYRDAQVSLATQYFLGRGAPLDYAEAARWYERAAEQGDEGAAYIIASQYETGNGVQADTMRAFYWYSIAAAGGDLVAAMKAREMRERLNRTR
ncbi:MAG TPA: tetratricopeptide repeat protein [Burkholderiaceae bacterium]|nr:tetratricopeptide repeat protein [Burkholderiaceae bacterium]